MVLWLHCFTVILTDKTMKQCSNATMKPTYYEREHPFEGKEYQRFHGQMIS
jgi:hypothetical protein